MNPNDDLDYAALAASSGRLTEELTKVKDSLTVSDAQREQLKDVTFRQRMALILLALFFVGSGITFGIIIKDNSDKATCVSNWADAYTKRVNALTDLSRIRQDALDNLIGTLSLPQAKIEVAFKKALDAYGVASTDYKNALKANPVPKAPKFSCN